MPSNMGHFGFAGPFSPSPQSTMNELGFILHSGDPNYQAQIDYQVELFYEEWITAWTKYQGDITVIEQFYNEFLGTGSNSARQKVATWVKGCDKCMFTFNNQGLIYDGNNKLTICQQNAKEAQDQYFAFMKFSTTFRK